MDINQGGSSYSKVLYGLLIVLFILSTATTYHTMIVMQDFEIYTDEESLPETPDFLSYIFSIFL